MATAKLEGVGEESGEVDIARWRGARVQAGRQAGSSLIRLRDGAAPRGHPTGHNFLEYPIQGVSQLMELHPTQTHEVKDAQVLIPACLVP